MPTRPHLHKQGIANSNECKGRWASRIEAALRSAPIFQGASHLRRGEQFGSPACAVPIGAACASVTSVANVAAAAERSAVVSRRSNALKRTSPGSS